MNLLLKKVCWMNDAMSVSGDVRIRDKIISEIGVNLSPGKDDHVLNFDGDYLYAGLINAHDHLEMNLYPKLGTPPYKNYVEWAKDIYHPERSPLREIEKVNIETRLIWGGLKNLIAGVTTVIHHNPWHHILGKKEFPVNVPKISWAHSLALEKNLSIKTIDRNKPFAIHAAEGIDGLAFAEVPALHALQLLGRNSVLIHAIALTQEHIQLLTDVQASVVWCPASNLYMFNQTAPIAGLKERVKVSLGSDSTLTGSPTLLHEIKVAEWTRLATASEIYAMVSQTPAQVFNLPHPSIAIGSPADLFITRRKNDDYFQNLVEIDPADISVVMTNGIPRLITATVDYRWSIPMYEVIIQGTKKFCDVNVRSVKKKISEKVSSEILSGNPLWNLLQA